MAKGNSTTANDGKDAKDPTVTLYVQIDGIAGTKKVRVPAYDVDAAKARIFREGVTDVQNNGARIRTYSPYKIACIDQVKK